MMSNELIKNIDLLHTTELGAERIKKNIGLKTNDVVQWCKQKILQSDDITRKGKNWYAYTHEAVITVNAHSYTVITAHKKEKNPLRTTAPARIKNDAAYTQEELQEALRAIHSTIGKCEKVLPKLPEGKAQYTLTVRRIKALQIAAALIAKELERAYDKYP